MSVRKFTRFAASIVATMALTRAPEAFAAETFALTHYGAVSGVSGSGVYVFKGIPYAAPPVGPLRWSAPVPPTQWQGVRLADAYGPACPQVQRAGPRHLAIINEDCLYLNVFAPQAGHRKLPVMVWIHGGAFVAGTASSDFYDGSGLARHGVIVVTLNYRLGRLGWSSPSGARDRGSPQSNWGLLDQVAALRWVKGNISAFGGDPSNVTLFGESAGAICINLLMASPPAQGLFRRAIVESGLGRNHLRSEEEAEAEGEALASKAGGSLEKLRARPFDDFIDQHPALDSVGPVLDGVLVHEETITAFEGHHEVPVPYLIGSNDNEATLFASRLTDPAAILENARRRYGPSFDRLHPGIHADPAEAAAQLVTDQEFTEPARALAHAHADRGVPTYRYHFAYVPEARRSVDPGVGHGDEIEFVFGTLGFRSGYTASPVDRAVSDQIARYWTNFAKTGDPNDPTLPKWRADSRASDSVQLVDKTGTRSVLNFRKDQLDRLEPRRDVPSHLSLGT